jgi:hypothetical protein
MILLLNLFDPRDSCAAAEMIDTAIDGRFRERLIVNSKFTAKPQAAYHRFGR